jgi:O-antigen/teichoic acid export membrane protein
VDKRRVVANVGLGIAAQLAVKVLSFVFNVFIVRTLGPETYGQYAVINSYGQIYLFLADLGLSLLSVRTIAQLRNQPASADKIHNLYVNIMALRIILALLSSGAAIATAWLTGRPWMILAAMALNVIPLLLYAPQSVAGTALAGYERTDVTSRLQVLFQFLFVVFGAIALVMQTGYFGLIIANTGAVAILTWLTLRGASTLGVQPGKLQPSSWPSLLKQSFPFAVVTLALGFSYKFDSILIELHRGPVELGYYSSAYNLIFSCVMFSNVLNSVLFPTLSRQAATDSSRLTGQYERVLRYLLVVGLGLTIGIFMLSRDLIPFLFRAEYTPASDALMRLIWVVPLMYASEFLGYVILISNRERIVARSVLISSLINAAANVYIVPTYGFLGAAVMTVITEGILVCQYVWLLRDQLKGMDLGRVLLRPLLAVGFMAGVLVLTDGLPWLIRAAIGGMVYAGALVAMRVLGPEELALVKSFRRRPA